MSKYRFSQVDLLLLSPLHVARHPRRTAVRPPHRRPPALHHHRRPPPDRPQTRLRRRTLVLLVATSGVEHAEASCEARASRTSEAPLEVSTKDTLGSLRCSCSRTASRGNRPPAAPPPAPDHPRRETRSTRRRREMNTGSGNDILV